jgi:hypothetical protein
MMAVRRLVSCFDKASEEFVREIPLDVPLSRLQEIFGEPKEDPMYEGYLLTPQLAAQLQPYASEPIDLATYDCFLDCYRVS